MLKSAVSHRATFVAALAHSVGEECHARDHLQLESAPKILDSTIQCVPDVSEWEGTQTHFSISAAAAAVCHSDPTRPHDLQRDHQALQRRRVQARLVLSRPCPKV